MIRKRKDKEQVLLSNTTKIKVRFSEVDSMRIVWHGNYVKFFEDGREAFGMRYPGLGYMDIYAGGYTAPIVDMQLQYLKPLTIGQEAVVQTDYIATDAAKICFRYQIMNLDGELVARGSTMQVFVDLNGDLSLNNPPFYEQWKKKWLNR